MAMAALIITTLNVTLVTQGAEESVSWSHHFSYTIAYHIYTIGNWCYHATLADHLGWIT